MIKNFQKAFSEFSEALKISPKSDDSLYYRAICHKMLENNLNFALEDINQALKENKEFPIYLLAKGLILYN